MKRSKQLLGVFVLGGVVGAAGLAVQARAAGVPSAPGLTYTGYLEDADGAPLTKAVSIAVEVYDAAEAGHRICDKSVDTVTPVAGRFQLELPAECTTAVHDSADLWVDVKVDGGSLGRTKLGAVPYALEAERASGAAGALNERISLLEKRLGSNSAFRANLTAQMQLNSGKPGQLVPFDKAAFDLGAEFDTKKHAFVPKVAGYYYVACSLTFESAASIGYLRTTLLVNGQQAAIQGFEGLPSTASRTASKILKLAKGDAVTCFADQYTGSNVLGIRYEEGVTHFEATRLSIAD